jgi:hypothetical protein
MKKNFSRNGFGLFIVVTIFSLLLSACGPGGTIATGGDGTIIWIDQPMTNYMLPMAPFNLIAHAGHPGAGISQVNFLVNGVSVGSVATDTSLEFLRSDISWNPSGPGLYTIQAEATSPGGITYSHVSHVCVTAGISSPQPWVGDCSSTTGVPFVINFNLDPAPVYFGSCPSNILQFQAKITGDTSPIVSVQASWNFANSDGSSVPLVSGESGLTMAPFDPTTYTYDRDFTNAARDFGLTADTYLLYGSVWAVDGSGNRLDTQTIGPIPWNRCTETSPTATSTILSTTPVISPTTVTPVSPTRTPSKPTVIPFIPTVTPTIEVCTVGSVDATVTDGSTWDASWAPYVTLCINGNCQNPNNNGIVEWILPAGPYTITSSTSAYVISPPTATVNLDCGGKSITPFTLSIP